MKPTTEQLLKALRELVDAAEALADSTLPSEELKGNQKTVTPANMFIVTGSLDIRIAIKKAG